MQKNNESTTIKSQVKLITDLFSDFYYSDMKNKY